jgi:predicted PurR-regulated permease PerM
LRAYVRELAGPLGLEWPSPPPQTGDADAASRTAEKTAQAWLTFAGTVEKIRQDLGDESWNRLADQEQRQQALTVARQDFRNAIDQFYDFKTTLLGGPLRAWMIEVANPDEQEVRGYVERFSEWGRDKVVSFGGATTAFILKFLFGMVIMALALFSFFLDGPAMLAGLKHLTPLDDAHEDELIREFEKVSRAVVLATLLSALAQGLLGAVGYYFAGLEPVILLMLLTMTLALVPFVGAAAVWVPASLYLIFLEGSLGAGIFLAIYGAAVISLADNVIKPFVLHGGSNLHPLWALLSVLGGVTALGPVGILVGPMVVAFLQTLLGILQREISGMETTHAGGTRAGS